MLKEKTRLSTKVEPAHTSPQQSNKLLIWGALGALLGIGALALSGSDEPAGKLGENPLPEWTTFTTSSSDWQLKAIKWAEDEIIFHMITAAPPTRFQHYISITRKNNGFEVLFSAYCGDLAPFEVPAHDWLEQYQQYDPYHIKTPDEFMKGCYWYSSLKENFRALVLETIPEEWWRS